VIVPAAPWFVRVFPRSSEVRVYGQGDSFLCKQDELVVDEVIAVAVRRLEDDARASEKFRILSESADEGGVLGDRRCDDHRLAPDALRAGF